MADSTECRGRTSASSGAGDTRGNRHVESRRRLAARNAVVLASVTAVVCGLGACQQEAPTANGEASPPDMSIVGIGAISPEGAPIATDSNATPADPAGDGQATCPAVSIATAGALTGPDAALGINARDGAQLAVERHNAANPRCQVTLKTYDTEGDPQKATQIAPQIIDDASIIGLVGPTFSGETNATGGTFDQAGLLSATPAATNVTLSQRGWRTFLRGLANDGVQGPSIANYLKNTLGAKKVCVIDDSTDYGAGISSAVRETLGTIAADSCSAAVKKGDKDFSVVVTQGKSESPDAIFYGGYYTEAAALLQQLRDGGVNATFAVGDGAKDPQLVTQAGAAARDALMGCPCAPASEPFAADYTSRFGQQPGTYSAEAYDLATIMLKGIDSGHTTRGSLLDFTHSYRGRGVARQYEWTSSGELASGLIWMYKVQ